MGIAIEVRPLESVASMRSTDGLSTARQARGESVPRRRKLDLTKVRRFKRGDVRSRRVLVLVIVLPYSSGFQITST